MSGTGPLPASVPESAPPLDVTQPLRGPAYSPGQRAAATLVLLLVAAQGLLALSAGHSILSSNGGWVLLGGFFVLLASYALLLVSTTTIDVHGIRQTGLIEKKVAWGDIKQARLRRFGFVRRLVVSTGYGRLRAFYAGTPELLAAFERISAAYERKRG